MKILKKVTIILCAIIICLISTKIISNAETAIVTTETLRLRKEATTDSSILELISEYEKVEILESGLGDDGQWYKVKYNDITGYVYGEFIEIDSDNSSTIINNTISNQNTTNADTNTDNTTIDAISENTITNEVTQDNINEENDNPVEDSIETNITIEQENLNNNQTIEINTDKTVNENTDMYIIPLINASKIYTVKSGEELHIIQILNGWAYVNAENASGWVRCDKLS